MIAVIKNPGAGGVENDTSGDLKKGFADAGVAFKLIENEDPVAASREAIDSGYSHLCACGGDGTVAGVVNAIMRSEKRDLRLSIIPLGTGNIIATALELPSDLTEAAALIAADKTREIDVGKIGNEYFVLGLGIGATERFVTQTSDEAKSKLGRIAYLLALVRHTSSPTHSLRMTSDGKKQTSMRFEAITLANFWGTEKREMLEDTAPDDGVMECVVNEKLTKWATVRLAWRGLRGDLANDEDVTVFRGKRFTIETEPALPVQLDGNVTGIRTPIDVEVLTKALIVTAPK